MMKEKSSCFSYVILTLILAMSFPMAMLAQEPPPQASRTEKVYASVMIGLAVAEFAHSETGKEFGHWLRKIFTHHRKPKPATSKADEKAAPAELPECFIAGGQVFCKDDEVAPEAAGLDPNEII